MKRLSLAEARELTSGRVIVKDEEGIFVGTVSVATDYETKMRGVKTGHTIVNYDDGGFDNFNEIETLYEGVEIYLLSKEDCGYEL